MGMDPNQLAQMLQQQPQTAPPAPGAESQQASIPADAAASKVLELIIWAAGKKDELNLDLMAGAINTLASAYKSLSEQQQAGPPPQQIEMEMHKAAQEMELKQQDFDLNKAMKIHEMQLKEQQADQENQRKDQEASFSMSLREREQQHKEELNQSTLSSQHEIGMTKAKQGAKPSTSAGS